MSNRRSISFYPITLALIALAMIWVVGHGEAGEASLNAQQLFVVDTVDLKSSDKQVS